MVSSVGNIVNQLGAGSGIDTQRLVNDLVALERAAEDSRLDSRQESLKGQISGLGQLRSLMGEFEGKLSALANADTFDAKQASIPETSLMAINALNPEAVPGNYRLKIEQIARSQSLASGTFASLDEPVGTGSLTIRLGSWNDALDSFGVNANAEGATINIDESNNSLSGLRDAINDAGIGVQASIVGQEGSYQLLLTGPTGATNEIEITAAEDAGAEGLAAFNFNETQQNFAQQQSGLDALLRVNGLQVTRQSNTLSDVIDGVDFDIFNADINEEISINITEDRSQAEQAIRDFVDAYNTFKTEFESLTGFDVEEGTEGVLRGDPLATGLMRSVRGMLGSAVPGNDSGFSSLASLGIRTRLDGTLEINEDSGPLGFRSAMDNNYEQVKNLFVPNTSSSNARVDVTGFGARTQPGTYEVEITQQASRGQYTGDAVTLNFPLDTTGKDYSFDIRVNGADASSTISLPEGKIYNSADEIAADLQALINLDTGLKENQAKVQVSYDADAGQFLIESSAYGSDSRVSFTNVGADLAADLGITAKVGSSGTDVAGTVNGEAAFGYGQVLLPAVGSAAEGLKMIIAPGATNATVNFSRGLGSEMLRQFDTYLQSSGLIKQREDTVRGNLSDVSDSREALERRSEAFRARLENQFIAMESIVRSLNSTGSFLEGLNDRLPFTAPPR